MNSDNTPYEKIGEKVRSLADEIPFDIPDSWEWVRLGDVFCHNTEKPLSANNRTGTLLAYITTSNPYWNHFGLGKLREMYLTDEEVAKCTVLKAICLYVKAMI